MARDNVFSYGDFSKTLHVKKLEEDEHVVLVKGGKTSFSFENGNHHVSNGNGNGNVVAHHAKPGWYADVPPGWEEEAHFFKVEKVLFHGRSEYQDLFVFESVSHGKVAILNGSMQLTEKDEFAYQEMLTHLPLCSVSNPKKVLLVGGGDGGILREISRHPSVEQIHLCELDKMVIDVYKKFFPDISIGYSDPRLTVHIGDGIEFLRSVPEGSFDVIILDAFQQMGSLAEELADNSVLRSVARALSPGGVMSCPADSFWNKHFSVTDTIEHAKKIFSGSVNYAWCTVPAYASGMIGFMVCSNSEVDVKHPLNPLNPDNYGVAKGPPKYYNSEVHTAAFCLPSFAKKRCLLPKSD
uniref:Spermidine N-methyltransferase n=1 Tax=Erythroxylum coca TaxID=289672 RepID=A0A9E9KU71_ERYCB|nr:spermidine N-methyltransferase [Erythroxylum coca]